MLLKVTNVLFEFTHRNGLLCFKLCSATAIMLAIIPRIVYINHPFSRRTKDFTKIQKFQDCWNPLMKGQQSRNVWSFVKLNFDVALIISGALQFLSYYSTALVVFHNKCKQNHLRIYWQQALHPHTTIE